MNNRCGGNFRSAVALLDRTSNDQHVQYTVLFCDWDVGRVFSLFELLKKILAKPVAIHHVSTVADVAHKKYHTGACSVSFQHALTYTQCTE